MVFPVDGKLLRETRTVFSNAVNDCIVCCDESDGERPGYLVLAVKDRSCIRKLLDPRFSRSESGEAPGLFRFSEGDRLCLAFAWRPERGLFRYADAQLQSLTERERCCLSLVTACLRSELPFPMLYLVLEQRRIHLDRSGEVYLTPDIDLTELDTEVTESDCVRLCRELCIELLEGGGRKAASLNSLSLLKKKRDRNAIEDLAGLCRDLSLSLLEEDPPGTRDRISALWRRLRPGLLRAFLILCAAILVIGLVLLLCRLIFGENPFWGLLERSFEIIGTEKLTG